MHSENNCLGLAVNDFSIMMTTLVQLPMEIWGRIHFLLRRSAAITLQSITRALPARRELRTARRERALETIRDQMTYLGPPSSGAAFGAPYVLRVGNPRRRYGPGYLAQRGRVLGRLRQLGIL
jgi:hypothetical protein